MWTGNILNKLKEYTDTLNRFATKCRFNTDCIWQIICRSGRKNSYLPIRCFIVSLLKTAYAIYWLEMILKLLEISYSKTDVFSAYINITYTVNKCQTLSYRVKLCTNVLVVIFKY